MVAMISIVDRGRAKWLRVRVRTAQDTYDVTGAMKWFRAAASG
jgi:hypothetical protein